MVMVEKRDPLPVHVIGLVAKPGQITLPANQDLHLLDAIALAGGSVDSLRQQDPPVAAGAGKRSAAGRGDQPPRGEADRQGKFAVGTGRRRERRAIAGQLCHGNVQDDHSVRRSRRP